MSHLAGPKYAVLLMSLTFCSLSSGVISVIRETSIVKVDINNILQSGLLLGKEEITRHSYKWSH